MTETASIYDTKKAVQDFSSGRVLKFRGWNVRTKEMVDLHKTTPLALAIDPCIAGAGIGVYIPDHPEIRIMQYIGLKDIDGVEVYEGDICEFYEEPDEENFFFGIAYIDADRVGGKWRVIKCDEKYDMTCMDSTSFWNNNYRVVGNIFENSELWVGEEKS